MAKFRVWFYYEVVGSKIIEATSPDDARKKMMTILADEGIGEDDDIDTVDRNYSVTNVT